MSRKVIEVVQVLIDRIHQGGYTQRALEDDIYAESQRRIAVEKDRDHWKQARQDAIEAGELMQAEIETLRQELADAKRAASDEFTERQVLTVEQQQDATIWEQQLDAARAEIERLRAFVGKVRAARDQHNGLDRDARVEAALAELDDEPTPVAEPLDAEGDTCPGK